MNLTVERATDADAEALLDVQIAAFNHDDVLYGVGIGGPPGYDDINSVREKIRDEQYYKFVYEGQIVGGIGLVDEGDGHLHVDVLYIHPDYHNLGIGTRALTLIEQAYPAASRWTLNTPTYAIRNQHFYEKFGYVNMGVEHYPEISLIIYEKHMKREARQ